jgi:protein-L-isoaspartate(D-aspartate) O-methyltransferase
MFYPEKDFHASKEMRHHLADYLKTSFDVQDSHILNAFRETPREIFLPEDLPVKDAYLDISYGLVKSTAGGHSSAASHPSILSRTFKLAKLKPGMKVLDVGTGSAYTAALLSKIVGEKGQVVSIDINSNLVKSAQNKIKLLGLTNTIVETGDGFDGFPRLQPYDAILITCQQKLLSPRLAEQLKQNGILVIPLTLFFYTHANPMIGLKKASDFHLMSVGVEPGSFTTSYGKQEEDSITQSFTIDLEVENQKIGFLRSLTPFPSSSQSFALLPFGKMVKIKNFQLSTQELAGLLLYTQIILQKNMVLLYAQDALCGFRGLGIGTWNAARGIPDTFISRTGIFSNAQEKKMNQLFLLQLFSRWDRQGRPTIYQFSCIAHRVWKQKSPSTFFDGYFDYSFSMGGFEL